MSSKNIILALDAMGGDHGVNSVIPGAHIAAKERSDLRFSFFGHEEQILPVLEKYPDLRDVSTIHHAPLKIDAADKPSQAVRKSKDTSMRLAIEAVSNGNAQGVVSGGNTGALMALSKMILKCLPGIDRPAIASVFPAIHGKTTVLDLGANLECDVPMLIQFAMLGSIYSRLVLGHSRPTVGLLNVGSEEQKGHEELRQAGAILSQLNFSGAYKGFVEGDDLTNGEVDVVVTDGFTGNVALKTAEGVGKLSKFYLKETFKTSFMAKLGALFALGALRKMQKALDPRLYNGGMFLGLNGICVKSHGGMDEIGFANAICYAYDLVKSDFNKKVTEQMAALDMASLVNGVKNTDNKNDAA
ncbi:MAG: phosphate acyltransferase PlsX [Alphaproteobacteria bacterium]|nr:phosphate acyltransferase PlsX [Alphaproteobacteria bacterium]